MVPRREIQLLMITEIESSIGFLNLLLKESTLEDMNLNFGLGKIGSGVKILIGGVDILM